MASKNDEVPTLLDHSIEDEPLNCKSILTFVNSLSEKIAENLKLRYLHGDNPIKFMESELLLHEAIKKLSEVPVESDLLNVFLQKSNGLSLTLGLLTHKNPDIVHDVLSVLTDITDPEMLIPKNHIDSDLDVEVLCDGLLDKDILSYLADNLVVFGKIQHDNDDAFESITFIMQIFEHFLEMNGPNFLAELRKNSIIVPWLLASILHKEPESYNKMYAMEILENIMQQSTDIALWISTSPDTEMGEGTDITAEERESGLYTGLGGVKNFINALAIYRKQDIGNAQQEEFVSNCYLCLQITFLTPNAIKTFSDNQGIPLMVRMIRGNNKCLIQALRTIAMALTDNPVNCDTFVQCGGLKNLSAVFMYQGVITKSRGRDALVDEYVMEIFHRLLKCGNTETNLRVCMKFAENRGEKIVRLLDSMTIYRDQVRNAEAEVEAELKALEKIRDGDDLDNDDLIYDDRLYLRKCDLGYHALLNSIKIFLHLSNTGNEIILKLLIGLQSQLNLHPLEVISYFIEDYLSHLIGSENYEEQKGTLRNLLKVYLTAYDDLLKTEYLKSYISIKEAGESIDAKTNAEEDIEGSKANIVDDEDELDI